MVEVNDVVDKVYCINLKRRDDRMKLFHMLWDDILEYERFEAFDGTLIQFPETYVQDQFHNGGSVGCNLSHIAVLEDALANGYQKILVLEDDAQPCENFKNIFSFLYNDLPKDYKFCYLGGTYMRAPKMITKTVGIATEVKSTVAYIIDREFMQEFIDTIREGLYARVVDESFCVLQQKHDMHLFYPRIVHQYESHSDILQRNVYYSWMRDLQ